MSYEEARFGLGPDYTFVDAFNITGSEVVELRRQANWGTEQDTDLWDRVIEQSIAAVGVTDHFRDLVGVGFLAGNERHAVLCDLVVDPTHRGLCLGKAIIGRRIEIAEQKNIPYL